MGGQEKQADEYNAWKPVQNFAPASVNVTRVWWFGSAIRNHVLNCKVYKPDILELISSTFCRWRFTFYLYIFTYGVRFLKKVGTYIIMLS